MKKLLPVAVMALLCACNNSKKEKETVSTDATTSADQAPSSNTSIAQAPSGSGSMSYTVNDTARTMTASALVQDDKDKLSPGNDKLAIVTGNTSDSKESLTVNFVFANKPGVYPVVGLGMTKGDHVFGGILGGEPKITSYTVNLTEVTDLGDNGIGGHRWRLAGSIDQEVNIDAMAIMKMSPGHPDAIKLRKISFSNLTYDDNWEEVLKKATDKLKQ